MDKYTRIRSYTPNTPKKPAGKQPISRGKKKAKTKVGRFLQGRWTWFKGLSRPKKALVIILPILLVLVLIAIGTYLYYASTISDPEKLMNYNSTGVVLMDKNGETFYSFGTANKGERLALDQISDYTEKALIASEDKNFYDHGGFSPVSIIGALFANLRSGDATGYGGSTLTQQLAKNTLLSSNQTFLRKYQELTVSVAIEQRYSKNEILDMYLNSVYYGEGSFGIAAAAKNYFGKSAADLDLAESAMLIGVLPAPSAYSPISGNMEYAKERQATVLQRMVNNGVITEAEAEAAKAQELAYAAPDNSNNDLAPHFAEMVLKELYAKYGEEVVTRSGYRVTTTLDLGLQRSANESVANQMNFIQRNGGSNASVVAIDPTSGAIRALVGSADYNNTDFGKVNMATSLRQPGSSIKPLYYTEAMQRRIISPGTVLQDKATDFGGYKPQNADRRFRGNVTARSALAQSLNIPAVEVMQQLGVEQSTEALKRLGLTTLNNETNYGLSLALGSSEAKLTEMTNAYAAFANSGNQFDITSIVDIKDKFDAETFKSTDATPERVMSEEASFLISDILNDESARAPIFGSSLNTNGYDVAVKTGTTDEARDAWTIGYSKQLAVGVWVGNNDNTAMLNGGSAMAGPIWRNVMLAGLRGQANQPFTAPSNVERIAICAANGLRAVGGGTEGVYQEYFIKGASPTETCNVPEPPKDADGDGVIDADDKCANTPAGTRVDATGCPIVEEPVDSDGDGVPDDKDECPNTPAGTTVGANGCPVVPGGSTGSGSGTGTGSGTGSGSGTGTGSGAGTGSGTGGGASPPRPGAGIIPLSLLRWV